MQERWLDWAQQLQAIAQNGLTYSRDPYDIERYHQVASLAAEIVSQHSDLTTDAARALFARQTGHATPKVDVRAAVFHEDRLLLVRERSDGLWTLPGGWADIGESPSEAIERETFEEAGYRTRAERLLAVYDRSRHEHPPQPFYVYKLLFHCQLLDPRAVRDTSGKGAAFGETDEVAFFTLSDLPPLSTERITAAQLAQCFALYQQPGAPTVFD